MTSQRTRVCATGVLTRVAFCLLASCAALGPHAELDPVVAQANATGTLPPLTLTLLRDGVWLHRSWRRSTDGALHAFNGLLVCHDVDAYLIEPAATPEQTEALYQQAKAKGVTIWAALISEGHDDRVLGLDRLAREHGVATYGLGRAGLEARAHGLPAPQHALPVAGKLSLIGTKLEYFYPGPGHSTDNLLVYLPHQTILFAGDTVRAQEAELEARGEADLSPWRTAIEKIRERYPKASVVIPGEGKPGTLELLDHTEELLDSALADISGRFGGG